MSVFVTGTDTGVGKTSFSCWLLARLREKGSGGRLENPVIPSEAEGSRRAAGESVHRSFSETRRDPSTPLRFARDDRVVGRPLRCAGYKPICCGDRQDAELLLAAGSAGLTIEQINPIWLKTPAAPLTAALAENRELDLASLRQGFVRLSEQVDFVVVEGVGGWIVPITDRYFSSDLATDLQLPVLVVAHNRLGCLNHTFLTVRNIEAAGLRCLGVILNNLGEPGDLAAETNADILRRCLSIPIVEGFRPELLSLLL